MDPTIPPSLLAILSRFQERFPRLESYRNFLFLVMGWILCGGRHTISRVIQASGEIRNGRGHSAYYRFFSRAAWEPDEIGFDLLRHLLTIAQPGDAPITLIVDDTLAKKRGPRIYGAGMHHDGTASSYGRGPSGKRHVSFAYGHSWVVISAHVPLPWNPNRGISIPILSRLYRSKKLTPEAEYVKRTELARKMIGLLFDAFPDQRFRILGDNEYACGTTVRDLPGNTAFVGPMPKDAALYGLPGSRTRKKRGRKPIKGARLRSLEHLASNPSIPWQEVTVGIYGRRVPLEIKTFRCLWYTVAGTRPVRVVYTRDPRGRYEERVYFATDITMTGEDIVESYAMRWTLECSFRNGKQSLGIADPQNGFWRRTKTENEQDRSSGKDPIERARKAVLHTFPFAILTYSFVIVWYLQNGRLDRDLAKARERSPWYRHKSSVSFDDMLRALRAECLRSMFVNHPSLGKLTSEAWEEIEPYLVAA